MSAAFAMAHGKYLVTTPVPASITVEGATVTFSTAFASGYPKADSGFATAAGLGSADYTLIAMGASATANSPATLATEIALIPASAANTTKGLTCYVKYAEPASATGSPTITVVTTGC